jgi:thioredoxin reductase (NADPH)
MDTIYDVIILGSGPSGLTAAIYTTRANLKTLIIAGEKWGGQLQLTSLVENFPGFPEGIQGPDLMMAMRKQAEHHGAEIIDENFKTVDFTKRPFTVTYADKSVQGKSVIVATGADAMWLGVPGEEEKIGKGVSSCATCDAAFFRNKNVIVVGGGDSAMEEALVLSRVATSVTVVYRGDTLRASQIMQDRAFENEKIRFVFNTVIEEIMGGIKVEKVKLKTACSNGNIIIKPGEHMTTAVASELGGTEISKDDSTVDWELPIDGVFVAIGHIPNTKAFQGIDLDDKGYIKVHDHYRTNVEGVFTAGDVHDRDYRQAITAAGFGSAAALETERWLAMQKV